MRCRGFRALVLLLVLGCSGGTPTAPSTGGTATGRALALGIDPSFPPLDAAGVVDERPESVFQRFRVSVAGKPWRSAHAEFSGELSCRAFTPGPGVHVITRFGRFADLFVDFTDAAVKSVVSAPGFVRWELSERAIVPPAPRLVIGATRAGPPEKTARGGQGALTGKGVVVAVIDSGIDFRHPDFVGKDASGRPVSRILAFWDTTSQAFAQSGLGGKAPVDFPTKVPLGTVYTRDQLTADLRAAAPRIGVTDANGHGTACAGIAAGKAAGVALSFSGVAPEADVVAVRIGGTPTKQLENTYLLGAALSWIEEVAAGRPYVVSCSFGGQFAFRDGHRVQERQIDARFADGARGKAILVAAGNEGADRIHAETACGTPSAPRRIEWEVPAGVQAGLLFLYAGDDTSDLDFALSPNLAVNGGASLPESKSLVVSVAPMGQGRHSVSVWSRSGKPVVVDAYLQTIREGPKGEQASFVGPAAKAGKQVASPGTARQALTVGSYDFSAIVERGSDVLEVFNVVGGKRVDLPIGDVSGYSNPGPYRVGEGVKPDFLAPGRFHPAPLAKHAPPDPARFSDAKNRYEYVQGTSSATPYAAGVVALMLQKNPTLTVGQIRSLIRAGLTKSGPVGAVPNPAWGYGKMDLDAVRRILASVKAP